MENFTTETIELAEALINIETANYHTWNKWFGEGKRKWTLLHEAGVTVTAEKSTEGLCWYLWKTRCDSARGYLKVVPTCASKKTYKALIESQPWDCI